MGNRTFNDFIRFLQRFDRMVVQERIDVAWDEVVLIALKRRRQIRRRWTYGGVAAGIAVFVLLGVPFFFQQGKEVSDIELFALHTNSMNADDYNGNIRLKVNENEVIEVTSTEARLEYSTGGVVISDIDTVARDVEDLPQRYNQLIVPGGKRAHLSLGDGTTVIVNSRSRVVYPADIRTGERKIFVEGEAYFDVAHDEHRPFIIHTARCDISVLGTAFNVCAYAAASSDEVVLVRGKVEVGKDGRRCVMQPGQLVCADESELSEVRNVDVAPYLSWTQNIIICDSKPIDEILERLHCIYGVNFNPMCDLSHMQISGKLELKESLEEVLDILAYSVPLEFTRTADTIAVSRSIQN